VEAPGPVPGFLGSAGGDRLRILHVIVNLGPANAQFNEHCLPMRHVRDLSICSLHERSVDVPPEIAAFEGDGTTRGFARALTPTSESGRDIIHRGLCQGTFVGIAQVLQTSPRDGEASGLLWSLLSSLAF
jgi:hypothetical protein